MCECCWNLDTPSPTSKQTCNLAMKGPYLITFAELKEELVRKWTETNQTHFRIRQKAVYNPPKESYVFRALAKDDNGRALKEADLSLIFL